ncbi:hypothetical protein LIER_05920 [Lithospermum erythrorhizon]|uniref:Uncharacterized protein n=1 Tax=Lithospermum erythrorhizon TaxID=34254 RepID=A0AAV3P4Y8_LITER
MKLGINRAQIKPVATPMVGFTSDAVKSPRAGEPHGYYGEAPTSGHEDIVLLSWICWMMPITESSAGLCCRNLRLSGTLEGCPGNKHGVCLPSARARHKKPGRQQPSSPRQSSTLGRAVQAPRDDGCPQNLGDEDLRSHSPMPPY